MNKRNVGPISTLCLELCHGSEDTYRLVVSIPGREGTVEHLWRKPVPWEDVQVRVLALLAEYLLLTGGVQLSLDDSL